MSVEHRLDDAGGLDEVVAFGAYVHLERMSDREWCLIVEADGQRSHVFLAARRAHVDAVVIEAPSQPVSAADELIAGDAALRMPRGEVTRRPGRIRRG